MAKSGRLNPVQECLLLLQADLRREMKKPLSDRTREIGLARAIDVIKENETEILREMEAIEKRSK